MLIDKLNNLFIQGARGFAMNSFVFLVIFFIKTLELIIDMKYSKWYYFR